MLEDFQRLELDLSELLVNRVEHVAKDAFTPLIGGRHGM
jgi:hypothetical protein